MSAVVLESEDKKKQSLVSNRRLSMTEGGFLIKFDGKEVERCYAVSFDYDEWQYVINETEKKELPAGVKAITIEVEK